MQSQRQMLTTPAAPSRVVGRRTAASAVTRRGLRATHATRRPGLPRRVGGGAGAPPADPQPPRGLPGRDHPLSQQTVRTSTHGASAPVEGQELIGEAAADAHNTGAAHADTA